MEKLQVSFSGGRSSAYMVHLINTIPQYHTKYQDVVYMFANTGKELPGTLDFVNECSIRWGIDIIWIEYCENYGYKVVTYETASRNGEPFSALIEKKKYLPNRVARFCTSDLKIRPMKKFLMKEKKWTHWDCALGIRYDEFRRYHKLKNSEGKDRWDYVFPLFDLKRTKADVNWYWNHNEWDLSIPSEHGNCDFCFLKGLKKKIAQAKLMPDKLSWWIEQENKTSGRFHNNFKMEVLLSLSNNPELFDDTIECFCGD